jgi:hypothetical protein
MLKLNKKDIKKFEDIESPYRNKSFEEITGESFEPKVKHRIRDLGNGYGTTDPIENGESRAEK